MMIIARNDATYARLQYHIGPHGGWTIPVKIDFNQPFPASDFEAWNGEYLSNVMIEPDGKVKLIDFGIAKVFERAGNFAGGSITGFFTVLVEGDDFNEPICDAVRAILDGHVILSRQLGAMGHYPAIDILNSVSRLASRVASAPQQEAARKIREALANYQQSEDLINLGAYAAGSNTRLDAAIRLRPALLEFLRQAPEVAAPVAETLEQLAQLAQYTS
jgi:flagellar biosynthesis/type III secretory pathway ATPase